MNFEKHNLIQFDEPSLIKFYKIWRKVHEVKHPVLLKEESRIRYGELSLDKGDLRQADEEWMVENSKLRVVGCGLRRCDVQ